MMKLYPLCICVLLMFPLLKFRPGLNKYQVEKTLSGIELEKNIDITDCSNNMSNHLPYSHLM